jgi:hypothetical protein
MVKLYSREGKEGVKKRSLVVKFTQVGHVPSRARALPREGT